MFKETTMNQIIIHIHYDISDTDFSDSYVFECTSVSEAKVVIDNLNGKINTYGEEIIFNTLDRLKVFSQHSQCREDLSNYILKLRS